MVPLGGANNNNEMAVLTQCWKFLLIFCILELFWVDITNGSVCDEINKFGWKCRFSCNCVGGQDCDRVTGHCANGCATGFYGTGCQFADNYIYGDKRGISYAGSHGKFGDKVKCLSWSDPRIPNKRYKPASFPDKKIPGPFCRNPFDSKAQAYASKPFCWVESSDGVVYKICDDLLVKECPDFMFSSLCDQECHCSNQTEICDKDTGFCTISQKCYAGWTSINCNKPCPHNTYGIDCTYTCGNCLHDSCDKETGRCSRGCMPGFHGVYCQQRCSVGTFGIGCLQTCGKCKLGGCDPVTGQCAGGCEDGYEGVLCKKRCPTGRFGPRCEGNCPYCLRRGKCHPKTGKCYDGCEPGFMGDSCDTVCPEGYYGSNCTMECGNCASGAVCDRYTGHCIEGCMQGFQGSACLAVALEVEEANSSGGIIAGVIVGILVTVAVILFVIYRKRRFRSKLVVNSHNSDRMSPTTETTLENIRETDLLLNHPTPEAVEEDCVDQVYDKNTKEPIYVNINLKQLTNPIPVNDVPAFMLKAKNNDYDVIRTEHGDLPTGLLALCQTALKPENKSKNRYADIIAYDHSRVVLSPLLHDPHSDYVNANYIDGYDKQKAYVASQGPNKAMLNDFWRMVWQEKITKIVMLTNLVETCKKKCEQYWPLESSSQVYGEINVEIIDTVEYTDFTIRTFSISAEKIRRIIKQFHFTSWTDHGAPTYPTTLLNFRHKVQLFNSDSEGPILVHCSAGIGRSGTYIAVDYLLQQAKATGFIDLPKCAQIMRTNRVNMIQTWQQYSFIYSAVLEALLAGDTTITNSAFPEEYEDMCTLKPDESSTPLEDQFEILQTLTPVIEKDECKAALDPLNIQKSRFRNILPANRFRPHLFTPVDGCNDFINAVFLHSYTQRDAYIVTQMPLPNTVADFWRLLYDYHSDTVVMLNEFDRNDKSCALYWPEEYGYTVEYGPLSIELLFSSEADTNITVRTFKLTNRLKGEDRAVKQFQFNAWPDYKSVPAGTTALLRLIDAVNEWTRQNGKGPVTVHCMNGASKCGLFCASCLVLERMRLDHEVDVYQTVKQVRIHRPHFVENMEQYQFCFQMALSYLERQPLGIDRQGDRQTNDSIDSGIQDKVL